MSDFQVDGKLVADVASFVRELKDAAKTVRELKDDVKELNDAIKELDGKEVRVKVVVEGQEEIRQLREDLDKIAHEHYEVSVGVKTDQDSITRLREDLDRINATGNTDVHVNVNVHGMDQLRLLRLELDALTLRRHVVRIDVDTGSGLAQLVAMRAAINGVQASASNAESSTSSFGDSLGGGGGGLMGIILALIPVIAMLGEVAAGVGAGLVGSFATMGVGVGAFAIFAIPTITKINKTLTDMQNGSKAAAKEWNSLSPAMKDAVTSLKDFKDHYAELQKQLEPTVLRVFAAGLNVARAGLDQLAKVAQPAGEAIAQIMQFLAEDISTGPISKFFDYVTKNIKYFMQTWGLAILNFLDGIANLIQAFDPLSKFVSNGFLNMSQSFLNWSQNVSKSKGFQEFVSFVESEGPKVLNFVGGLIKLLWQLIVAFAPLGAQIFGMINTFVQWIAKFAEANPKLTAMLGLVISLAGAAMTLAPLIMALVGAIGEISAPVLAVVGAIGIIIAIMLVWWNKCASFRDFVKEMWGKIVQFFKDGINMAKQQIAVILPMIVELWNKYGKNIMDVVRGAWTIISSVIKGAMQIIFGIIRVVLSLLTGNWKGAWNGLLQILKGVWTIIKGVVTGGLKMIKGLLGGFVTEMWNVGSAIVKGLWSGIQAMWGWITSKFSSALKSLRNMLPFSPAKTGPFSGKGWTLYSGMAIVQGLADGIDAQKSSLQKTMLGMVSMMHGALPDTLNATVNGNVGVSSGAAGMAMAMAGVGAVGSSNSAVFQPGSIQINNPTSEPASDSLNRTMTRISRFGIFEGAS